jgi:hypothetical protein
MWRIEPQLPVVNSLDMVHSGKLANHTLLYRSRANFVNLQRRRGECLDLHISFHYW